MLLFAQQSLVGFLFVLLPLLEQSQLLALLLQPDFQWLRIWRRIWIGWISWIQRQLPVLLQRPQLAAGALKLAVQLLAAVLQGGELLIQPLPGDGGSVAAQVGQFTLQPLPLLGDCFGGV